MVSTPADDDTYGVGEIIQFQVTLSAAVDVVGEVVMGTYVGDWWRGATYRSGSGTNKLIFGYKVQSADMEMTGSESTGATRTATESSMDSAVAARSSYKGPTSR